MFLLLNSDEIRLMKSKKKKPASLPTGLLLSLRNVCSENIRHLLMGFLPCLHHHKLALRCETSIFGLLSQPPLVTLRNEFYLYVKNK